MGDLLCLVLVLEVALLFLVEVEEEEQLTDQAELIQFVEHCKIDHHGLVLLYLQQF